jgi:hypothetical protein
MNNTAHLNIVNSKGFFALVQGNHPYIMHQKLAGVMISTPPYQPVTATSPGSCPEKMQ